MTDDKPATTASPASPGSTASPASSAETAETAETAASPAETAETAASPAETAETAASPAETAATAASVAPPEPVPAPESPPAETAAVDGTADAGSTEPAAAAPKDAGPAKRPAGGPRRNVKQQTGPGPKRARAGARTSAATAPARRATDLVGGPADEVGGRDGWRRVGAVAIVLVAAFAVVVLWARPAHEPAPPSAQRSSAPVAITVLNPTDIAYLQLMISLDTSAVQLFELIIAGGDPVLAPIARSAADSHRAELAALRKALTDGGAIEDSSIHAGHDLPGMVVEADMAAIRAVPAAQQPAKAIEVLRDHLTGTTALCGSEAKNGADPATKAAAEAVLDVHGKLLTQLPTM